jgi:hypothetical protein
MTLPRRWALRLALAALALTLPPFSSAVAAQGTTTGAIGGTVTGEQNQPIEGAQVQIVDRSTGFTTGALTRSNGAYQVQGLEPGGNYTVTVRRIGYTPQTRENVRVNLSQVTRADFALAQQATQIEAVTVTAQAEGAIISPDRVGSQTSVSDTMISRLPSLNRDFTDFARIAPQVAAVPGSGLSGGGVNNRFNSIQIDGASASDLFGLGSTGQPGGSVGAKSISVESVKEYQVLLSPYDVRQGNFVGVLVNAVTKSGTNDFTGSVYGYMRDQALTRDVDYLNDFRQEQFGFSLGGPIVQNRAFFFINPEFQRQTQPTAGPFVGSQDSPVTQATLDAFNAELTDYGIRGGTGAYIANKNPLTDIFARIDVNLPWSSRLALRHKYGRGEQTSFSRASNGTEFRLTSNAFEFTNTTNQTVGQLFTNLANGFSNELQVGYTIIDDFRSFLQAAPQIEVRVPRIGGGTTNLIAGTERSSQGNELYQTILEISDNVSFPIGPHNFTIGTKNFFYYSDNLFAQDRFGRWQFQSLDSLRGTCAACNGNPLPSLYSVRVPIGEQARARFNSATYGVYLQDRWQMNPRMNLLVGLRADIPVFQDKPPQNTAFETAYANTILAGRRTDVVPSGNIQWQPRIGFNWDVTGDQRNQFRAGIGSFAGPPAYVWLSNAFGNTGVSGFPALTCGNANPTNPQYPPAFNQNAVNNPPASCGGTNQNPATAAVSGAISILDPDFKFPQTLKTTVGFDHRFSERLFGGRLRDVVATLEALYSKGQNVPFYVNRALVEPDVKNPASYNFQGRLMYGTISGTNSTPNLIVPTTTPGGRSEIFDVINSNKDWSYNLTAGLTKRWSDNWEASLFYTYQQARDLQSTSNSTAGSNFGLGRIHGGSQYSQDLAPARWETPHRFVAIGTYTFPSRTSVTLFYVGNSGPAFSYYYFDDENADGQGNDIVYVPADVYDPTEIRFRNVTNQGVVTSTIAEQQAALDAFINRVDCLRNSRGRLLARNSCRSPWLNMVDLSARQELPTFRGQNVSVQLDVFNFGNLLNRDWGLQRYATDVGFPGVRLLDRVGTATVNGVVTPEYTFKTGLEYSTFRTASSNYRMQLSLRYSF